MLKSLTLTFQCGNGKCASETQKALGFQGFLSISEATVGLEPTLTVLQTLAWLSCVTPYFCCRAVFDRGADDGIQPGRIAATRKQTQPPHQPAALADRAGHLLQRQQ